MTATVTHGRRSSRSSTAWPRVSSASICAISVTPRNCAMSAPAMKPPGFAERMTTPHGGSRSSFSRIASSSVSTSSDSVLALESFLSNRSQAMPSSSVRMRQCGPRPGVLRSLGPPRTDRAPGCACREWPVPAWRRARFSCAAPSNRFDQHGAALAAADAFGSDAALFAEPLHGIDEMQHDPVAAGADRMADADGAAVDIEQIARDAACRRIEGRARRGRIRRPPRRRGSPEPARRTLRSAPTVRCRRG